MAVTAGRLVISAGWSLSAIYMRFFARPRLKTDDRAVLEERIFPALYRDPRVRRVLFVGVSRFTRWYPYIFTTRPRIRFETADLSPDARAYGARNAHWTCRFEELVSHSEARSSYDVVILNGVLGYGTSNATPAFEAARALLRPAGLLLLGYRDRPPTVDVDLADVREAGFEATTIPGLGASVLRTAHDNGHTFAAFRPR
jgi:SAM-dependent methyltransferase